MNWLPSAAHASSVIKYGAPGEGKIQFLLFSQSVPSPNMCIRIYYVIFVCLFVFFCVVQRKKWERRESLNSTRFGLELL